MLLIDCFGRCLLSLVFQILLNQWNLKALSRIAVIEQNQLENLIFKTWRKPDFKTRICVFEKEKKIARLYAYIQNFSFLEIYTRNLPVDCIWKEEVSGEVKLFSFFLVVLLCMAEFGHIAVITFKIKIHQFLKNLSMETFQLFHKRDVCFCFWKWEA